MAYNVVATTDGGESASMAGRVAREEKWAGRRVEAVISNRCSALQPCRAVRDYSAPASACPEEHYPFRSTGHLEKTLRTNLARMTREDGEALHARARDSRGEVRFHAGCSLCLGGGLRCAGLR